jgi:hypothetical protein
MLVAAVVVRAMVQLRLVGLAVVVMEVDLLLARGVLAQLTQVVAGVLAVLMLHRAAILAMAAQA